MSLVNNIDSVAEQLDKAKKRIDLIRSVTLELNKILSLPDKLCNILKILHTQFGIDHSIILLPTNAGKLVVKSSYGYDNKNMNFEVPFGIGITGLAAVSKRPINITGIRRKKHYLRLSSSQNADATNNLPGLEDPESQIAIPLVANNELVAVLMAESENVSVFSKDDEGILITLSQSIAVSIQNSLLFDNMEDIIAKRTEELRKINHTKDRLFSIISHDLRGPITSFHNISKLVNHYNNRGEKEKIENLSARIDQSVTKLNSLLDNLLNWSLTQTNEIKCNIESISVCELIQEVLDIYHENILAKELNLIVHHAEPYNISGDYNTLSTVFRNVLSNAIKYTPRKGNIIVDAVQQGDSIQITFTDSGVGIANEKLVNIFEPSENKTTHGTEKEKGTGLGLLVAKEFIQLNNGSISMQSFPGKGTSVTISLPCCYSK
jgi:signal transduction histidine kinase